MRTHHHRPAAIIGAATIILALNACSNSPDGATSGAGHGADHGTITSASATDSRGSGDVTFAQQMIPHHEQAVEMADIALAKSGTSADVRRLATEVKAAQDPEIAQMRGWLSQWGAPATATAGMDHGHGVMTDEDMSALKAASGADFDRKWITMMISHHEGAVTMAEQVLTTTANPQVKALAEAIINAQKAEITTMKGLLES